MSPCNVYLHVFRSVLTPGDGDTMGCDPTTSGASVAPQASGLRDFTPFGVCDDCFTTSTLQTTPCHKMEKAHQLPPIPQDARGPSVSPGGGAEPDS